MAGDDEFDPLTAPLTMPREVRRVNGEGLPTQAQLDWEQAFKNWTVKQTVSLNTKITTVRDEAGDAFAQVQDQITAVVNDQGALASRVTTVEAGVGANTAAIHNEATARASADSAMATQISNLSATVGGNTAAINNEATVRANADSALASSISSLSTTVGGYTASISSLMSSVNGLGVQYAVQGYVGGTYGGFVFTGVRRADGVGANFLLEITANVIINGDLLVTGTVNNGKLADLAATQIATSSGDSSATVGIHYRGTGKVSVLAYYAGTPSTDRITVPDLTVSINGVPMESIQNNHYVWIPSSGPPAIRLLQTTILSEITPTAGWHNFSVSNGVGGGVRIWVFEGVEMNPGDILEPVDFVRYDPETGQILEVGNMAVGSVIRLGSEFGWSYIIGRARLGEDYVDVDRLDPVIAPRGPCPAAISGVVLSGLPIPCTVEVEDEAGDVSRAECSEPSLALDFDYPGAYVVTVRSVPYLDGTFTVEV